jgi:hypothetical protein
MRVVRDQETGGLLIAEAGSHGPFAEPRFHHAHLHAEGLPHERAGLGAAEEPHLHRRLHERDDERAMTGAAD